MTALTAQRLPNYLINWLDALNRFVQQPEQPIVDDTAAYFPVAVAETEHAVRFEVDLQGMTYTDAQVFVHRGQLAIQITRQPSADPQHLVHYCREFQLPASVKNARAAISPADGVLCVTLLKH